MYSQLLNLPKAVVHISIRKTEKTFDQFTSTILNPKVFYLNIQKYHFDSARNYLVFGENSTKSDKLKILSKIFRTQL